MSVSKCREKEREREKQTSGATCSLSNTYSCLARNGRLVDFLAAESSALVQSDAELVACHSRSIDIQTRRIAHVS